MRLVSVVMAALFFLAAVGPARAGQKADSARAREAFRSAQQHYKLAEYAQALDAFKETYRLIEDPSLLFNIAQCYRQLGKKEEAIRFFRTYLHDAPGNGENEDVKKTIASLEAALKQEQAQKQEAAAREAAAAAPPVAETKAPPPAVKPAPSPAPAPTNTLVASAPAHSADKPVYKRWWLWTTVGVVVAAGVGVGLGLALTRTPAAPTATTQDGTFHPF